jgi:hypothetical protein
MSDFVRGCNLIGFDVEHIPLGYTCVLQPVDVGFNAPLKATIRKEHQKWCIDKYKNLGNNERFPTPNKDDMIRWLTIAYDAITSDTIKRTFKHIGFKCGTENEDDDDNVNHDDEGEGNDGNEGNADAYADGTIEREDLALRPEIVGEIDDEQLYL